jgi:penicillin-binding protein 1A
MIEYAHQLMQRLVAFAEAVVTIRHLRVASSLGNAVLVIGAALLGGAASLDTPLRQQYRIEDTLRPAASRPLILIGADGAVFARRGDCMAEPVTLQELPPHLVAAAIAMEDRRFYTHLGVDPLGIVRAAKRNFDAGSTREGGSTITQQLVKMSYLTSAKTLQRKIEEAVLAAWLEIRLSKEEIIERYLSSAYFGEGCFGVRAATRHFFDKDVGQLTVGESALLVSLLRSPTQLTRNFDDARQRVRLVLQAMVRDGTLDEAQLTSIPPAMLNPARGEEFGSDYADWLADQLQDGIADRHSRQPIPVYTTFEPGLQRIAQDVIASVLDKKGKRLKATQAALVAMRTDGRVLAMAGGRDRASSQFNRAVQARRQPGSAFKTFIYLAALRAGAEPDMMISDEPVQIGDWEPQNYDGGYRGTVTLTQAFASSINTVAAKLSEAVGRETVIATARKMGIASPLVPNPSLALGTSEVSLMELTAAYAGIAAGAYPVVPWGAAGLEQRPANAGEPPAQAGIWRLEEAQTMRELLSAVVEYGSGAAAGLAIPAYGKTGTSQDYRDAWFIGFAGNVVVGVWVGNDDFSPMRGVTGGILPAEIWKRFMVAAMKADKGFDRKFKTVAAFDARARTPADTPAALASLDDVFAPAYSATREASTYGQTLTRGQLQRETQSFTWSYEAPRSGGSRDSGFKIRGWPGE